MYVYLHSHTSSNSDTSLLQPLRPFYAPPKKAVHDAKRLYVWMKSAVAHTLTSGTTWLLANTFRHTCTWVGSRYSSRRKKRGQTFRLVEPRANFLLSCCLKDWRHISLGLEVCMWYVAGLLSMGGHGTPGTPDFGRLVNPISTVVPIIPPHLYWHPRIFRPPSLCSTTCILGLAGYWLGRGVWR